MGRQGASAAEGETAQNRLKQCLCCRGLAPMARGRACGALRRSARQPLEPVHVSLDGRIQHHSSGTKINLLQNGGNPRFEIIEFDSEGTS